MSNTTSKSKIYNAIVVLLGALLMGMMWRVRGTHGWGSSWGLLSAGIAYVLFVTVALGERKKMNFSWTSLTGLSFMLTVPAWGTLLKQITGVLEFEGKIYEISPWSGVFMMICLGFGLASIFGVMLGRAYSDKQWKIHHILILIGVFYAVNYLAKATVSHWIIQLVQPEAISAFVDDLKAVGLEEDAYKTYMQHFDNDAWAKKFTMDILGRQSVAGRNYFQEIMTISSAISAVAVLFTTRFVIKDNIAALTGTVTCCAFAVAITLADLFFWFEAKGYAVPETYAAWSLWEYFTGFIAGGIITVFLVCLKKKDNIKEITFEKLPQKAQAVFTFLLGYVGIIGINVVRPVLERFDESELQIVYTAISVVITLAIIVLLCKKFGCVLQKIPYGKFSAFLLPCFIIYTYIAYMFIGSTEYHNYTGFNSIHNILVTISVVCVSVWSVIQIKNLKNK